MTRRLDGSDMFIWDAHAGFETRTASDLASLAEWRDAGVNFLSVNVGYDVNDWHATIKALAVAKVWLARTPGYRLVGTIGELEAAVAAGDMAVAFDIEGANALDGRAEMVRLYYDLGVRQMLLAYNLNNAAAGGCHDRDMGLTPFGETIVREMNDVGMLVDCSHCGHRTTMDIMARSVAPATFSHSNARALRAHERNILDEQAVACAATGGVVGVNGISCFVGEDDTTTASIVDHIEHYLDLIGAAHVGIGLDYFHAVPEGDDFNETVSQNAHFWPKTQYPEAGLRCANPRQMAEIATEMLRRNHTEAVVRGVLGENFKRLAQQVWK